MTIIGMRKALIFAMTLVSFLTIHIAGEVSALAAVAFYVGIIGAWFWEPPRIRYERWTLFWTVVSLGVFAWNLVDTFAFGENLLRAAMNFALFLSCAKLYQLPENKDYTQMMALTLLLVTSGSVLNDSISFGILFSIYVVIATVALTVQHLNVETFDQLKRAPLGVRMDRAILGTTISVSLLIFGGSLLFFFAFPRVGLGFFGQQGREGVKTSGFSDSVNLDDFGNSKADQAIVMRVIFPNGVPDIPGMLYFRGSSLDTYTGTSWINEDNERAESGVMRFDQTSGYGINIRDRALTFDQVTADTIVQEINLEPIDGNVLFSVGNMRAVTFPDAIAWTETTPITADRTGEVKMRQPRRLGIRYIAYSSPQNASAAELAAARWPGEATSLDDAVSRAWERRLETATPDVDVDPTTINPRDPEILAALRNARRGGGRDESLAYLSARYLQLPDDAMTPRMRQLAESLRAGSTSDYEFVAKLQNHLRAFSYTTDIPTPESADANVMDEFLFEWQRGHCQYFASAMVILLRSQGIPARIVNGFLGAEPNPVGGYFMVRQSAAHSWVEVYFPGEDWQTFDPTPAMASSDTTAPWRRKMAFYLDNVRLMWFRWVVEYDLDKQVSLVRDSFETSGIQVAQTPEAVQQQMRRFAQIGLNYFVVIVCEGFFAICAVIFWSRRSKARTVWGRADWAVGALWLEASIVLVHYAWPYGWTWKAVVFATSFPAAGTFLAYQLRRLLFSTDDGDKKARAGDISGISRVWMEFVQAVEREAGVFPVSATPREIVQRLDIEDRATLAALREFAENYERVRFSGRMLASDELKALRVSSRTLAKAVVRELKERRKAEQRAVKKAKEFRRT